MSSAARPKVAIVGGSFAGYRTALELSKKNVADVTLVEKADHHSHSFVFPKFSVLSKFANEGDAFLSLADSEHADKFSIVFDECTAAEKDSITLASGKKLPYDYLVIATGVNRPYPAGFGSVDRLGGTSALRKTQEKVKQATNIAIVGAGAFGIQLSTDIKWVYGDDKKVTLYNSRSHVLPKYPSHIGQAAEPVMKKLGVNIVSNTRPKILSETEIEVPASSTGEPGRIEKYDIIFNCTGQGSTTSPFVSLVPEAANQSGIDTLKTLQLPNHSNVFAIGDVNTAGPHCAKAAQAEGMVTAENISRLISSPDAELQEYIPTDREQSIKLTLGFDQTLLGMPSRTRLESHDPNYRANFNKIYNIFGIPYQTTGKL